MIDMRLRNVAAIIGVALLTCVRPGVGQEPYRVTVPDRGWAVTIDLPPLEQFQGQEEGGVFRFMGRARSGDVIVSFFVEPSAPVTSQDCRTEYWAKGSRNPMIVGDSVRLVDVGDAPGVSYVIEAEHQGQTVRSQNIHVYRYHAETCLDVHLSSFPLQEGAEAKLLALAATVGVEPLP
jgi:hypothetical protein